jgi:hypothetical protein
MSYRLSAIATVLLVLGAGPGASAQAVPALETKVFADISMSIGLPKDWKTETDGETTTSVSPAGDARVLIVTLIDPSDPSPIGSAFDAQLTLLGAKKIHWQAEEDVNKGSMLGIGKKGTTEMDGKAVNLVLLSVARDRKGAIICAIYDRDKPAYKPVIDAIVDSVKQVKK